MTRLTQIAEQIENYDRKIKAVRDDLANNDQTDKFVVLIGSLNCIYAIRHGDFGVGTTMNPLSATHFTDGEALDLVGAIINEMNVDAKALSAHDAKIAYEAKMVQARNEWVTMLEECEA